MKDKPTKWGMKLWVVSDAVTGYTYDFEVYTGKNKKRTFKSWLRVWCVPSFHVYNMDMYVSVYNLHPYFTATGAVHAWPNTNGTSHKLTFKPVPVYFMWDKIIPNININLSNARFKNLLKHFLLSNNISFRYDK